MIKRTIEETISEYNEYGRIVRQTITTTTEDDDNSYTCPFYNIEYKCAGRKEGSNPP